jgi:pimeloyl-ACP methyl ester carboxylesterase
MMPHVRLGDVDLYYELIDCTEPWHSAPPPVVLLHGLGLDRRVWLYQVPVLCGRVPTLTLDLRGHGRSSAPPGEWTVADMARDVVRLLRHLGAERAHLVGLSLGGMVAQQFALDYPQATASVVLVDTICGIPAGGEGIAADTLRLIETQPMAEIAKARITAAFTDAVDPVMRGHLIEAVAMNNKDAYERAARAAFGFSVCARLSEVRAPALIVIGEQDRTYPMEWLDNLAQRFSAARVVRLPGVAHISNMEHPEEFNRALLAFLGV